MRNCVQALHLLVGLYAPYQSLDHPYAEDDDRQACDPGVEHDPHVDDNSAGHTWQDVHDASSSSQVDLVVGKSAVSWEEHQ